MNIEQKLNTLEQELKQLRFVQLINESNELDYEQLIRLKEVVEREMLIKVPKIETAFLDNGIAITKDKRIVKKEKRDTILATKKKK